MPAAAALFLQSMLIGLAIAAPVGQIGVLAIQRSLQQGSRAGIATGLGAALADAVYGAVGAYGVATAIHWLLGVRVWFNAFGAVFLTLLAVRIWRQPVTEVRAASSGSAQLLRDFAGTFLLTLANPTTILSFIAVFGVLAGGASQPSSPAVMVAGVMVGSALWWLLLATVVGRLRHRFDARWQRRIARASALTLGFFALAQFIALARG